MVRFQSDDYYFIVHNNTPHCYLPILSDPTSINSDGDALDDIKDIEPLYIDSNPISYSNILSIEYKYIPLQEIDSIAVWIGRRLSKKWDCNVYVSIIKSCICEEDIFCIFTENLELSEAYPITSDLIKELANAEKEYQNSIYHVRNENAAHAGKLETDQLVPNYFDKNSSYYYGCWYHNYYHELHMSEYYSEKIDMASKAFLVYTAVLGMYQSKILASEQKAIQLSQEEYALSYCEEILGEGCKLPQGITQEQFSEASSLIRSETSEIGSDIVVQGSRASGIAKATSDIDIAIRVDSDKFSEMINRCFKTPNPGSAKERTMLHAIKTGKIQAGEAGLRGLRLELEEIFGMDVDISIIEIGGPFDNPPFIPFE